MRKILRRESRNWSGASITRVYFSTLLEGISKGFGWSDVKNIDLLAITILFDLEVTTHHESDTRP